MSIFKGSQSNYSSAWFMGVAEGARAMPSALEISTTMADPCPLPKKFQQPPVVIENLIFSP